MITYLAKTNFSEATYARPARQRAFTKYLRTSVPGSETFFTDVGGSSSSASGVLRALVRLGRSLSAVSRSTNRWIVVDYPNFPASVPRRLPVYLAARLYLAGLNAICRSRGAGLIVQSDDDPAMQDEWLGHPPTARQLRWERSFEGALYRSAERIWFSSRTAAQLICALFSVPVSKALVVPNGAVAASSADDPAVDGFFRFAYAGSLRPETHGVLRMIEAFAHVDASDARLMLAGPDGDWIPEYLQRHADGRVVYLGILSEAAAQSMLQACDAAILPASSGGYHDTGFPGKLGAYLAAGLPIISASKGDALDVVEGLGVGVVCDEASLGSAMAEFVRDNAAFSLMRTNAISCRERFLWEHIYERAVDTLRAGYMVNDEAVRDMREQGRGSSCQGEWHQ